MSFMNLNKKAISGKLKVVDYVGAVLSILVAAYFYATTGLSYTTLWSMFFALVAVALAFVNPAKRLNDMIVKKQTGQ